MNAGDSVSQNKNSRYHAELIRSLAEVGKMSISEKRFDVVQKFLKTACKITKADRITVYEYHQDKGFCRQYLFESETGAGYDLKPLALEKNKFIQWIETFHDRDSVIIRKRDEIPEQDLQTYEQIGGHILVI